jgi:hypothetical protein
MGQESVPSVVAQSLATFPLPEHCFAVWFAPFDQAFGLGLFPQ